METDKHSDILMSLLFLVVEAMRTLKAKYYLKLFFTKFSFLANQRKNDKCLSSSFIHKKWWNWLHADPFSANPMEAMNIWDQSGSQPITCFEKLLMDNAMIVESCL